MVEMKLVCGAACYTFSAVSFPYRELYRCGDQSAPLNVSFGRAIEALVSLNSNESVLEYFTVLVTFGAKNLSGERLHCTTISLSGSFRILEHAPDRAFQLYTVERRHGIFHFVSTHLKEIVRVDP
jgi:hypothetical protein